MDVNIKIAAVGGEACQALDTMIASYPNKYYWGEVEYIAIDSDPLSLANSLAPNKVQILIRFRPAARQTGQLWTGLKSCYWDPIW